MCEQTDTTFVFQRRFSISEVTDVKAANLKELVEGIKIVSASSIYQHTHRFLMQNQDIESSNDFAYWVKEILGDTELGEALLSINAIEFTGLRALREKIIDVIQKHIENNPEALNRFANKDSVFNFVKSRSFVIPTGEVANTLEEFYVCMKHSSFYSIYFHMMESKLRLDHGKNDFSNWLETAIGEHDLAKQIEDLDPYSQNLEALKKHILELIEKRLEVK